MLMFEEALLEPIARWFRFQHGLRHIPRNKSLKIVDLGCGPQIRFYHFARKNGVPLKHYIGIDPLVPASVVRAQKSSTVTILAKPLDTKISLPTSSVDVVTAFAFFEHIDNPKRILAEAYRILKPGGRIILTVPSPRAQAVLEFLAFRLKIISAREIEEHKNYFTKEKLMKLLPKNVFPTQAHHTYFEFGMNNLFVVRK